ncbi:MAG: 2-phosphosulfolactate phosphatase [Bacteroidota bacterium]
MNITIHHFIEGAREATGLTVIIDVFRAFSLECYLTDQGAAGIIPVGDISQAFSLKEQNPDYLLIGERNEQIVPGFDFGNSPFQVAGRDFSGKTIVHTTSAGTQGIVNASAADEILTGSFVNADAIVRYIRHSKPASVSLVCMGYNGRIEADEDTLCAEYLRNELTGKASDFAAMREKIRSGSGSRFFIPDKQHFAPKEDFALCLNLSAFNFVLKAVRKADRHEIVKIVPA